MRGFDEINAIMTKYGLSGKEGRARAYKIRNGEVEPPKKEVVGKVKVMDASALSEEEFRRLALLGQATVERARQRRQKRRRKRQRRSGTRRQRRRHGKRRSHMRNGQRRRRQRQRHKEKKEKKKGEDV